MTIGYAAVYIAFLLAAGVAHLREAGLQVTTHRAAGPLAFGLALAALVGRFVALEVWRDRVYGEPAPGDSVLYVRSGEACAGCRSSFTPLVADVYWVRAVQYYGGTRLSQSRDQALRPAVPAARHHDVARPAVQHRLPLRIDLPRRDATPAGAGRPDLAVALLEKGFRANPTRWQYLQDIGFVYYWWLGDYQQAARVVRQGGRRPGRAVVAAVAGRRHARPRAATGAVRACSGSRCARRPTTSGCATTPRLRLAQLDALDAIDQLTAVVAAFKARTGRVPGVVGRARAGADAARACRSTRPASPFVLDPATGARRPCSRVAPEPAAGRGAGRPGRRALRQPDGLPGRRPVRPRHRQLPQRLHLPAAARPVDRLARVALHGVRARAELVREHPGR